MALNVFTIALLFDLLPVLGSLHPIAKNLMVALLIASMIERSWPNIVVLKVKIALLRFSFIGLTLNLHSRLHSTFIGPPGRVK